MKKVVIAGIIVILVVFLALALISKNDDYNMERMYYQAMNTYKKIAINPDVAPPAMLSSVENKLQEIVNTYPDNPSTKVVKKTLAEFYIENKQYDKAVPLVDKILDEYADDNAIASQAQFLKGVIFERQGQWDKALQEYMVLRDHYTETPLGFQVPVYIGNHYRQSGMLDEADQAFRQAASFYKGIEAESKGTIMGYMAANMLLRSHMEVKNYTMAGQTLLDIIDTYPSELSFAQQLPKVELIYEKSLKSPEKALEIYRKIKNISKDPKIIGYIDQKIEHLGLEKLQE